SESYTLSLHDALPISMKLTTPDLPGLAVRYGIYLRADYWAERRFLVHELAHTAQYERLDGVRAFLECYLYQCLAIGSTSAPMERSEEHTSELQSRGHL